MRDTPLYTLDGVDEDEFRQPEALLKCLQRVPNRCLSKNDFDRIRLYITPEVMAHLAAHQHEAISGLRRFPAEVITAALEVHNYLFRGLLKKQRHTQGVFSEDFTDDLLLRVLVHVPSALRYIPEPTEAMCWEALESDPTVIECIDGASEAMMQRAVELDTDVILRIQDPPRELVRDTLSVNPDLLMRDGFIPRIIDAHTIEFYEAALGRKQNFTLLYPNARSRARVTVPVDAVLDPASRQLECLTRTLRVLDQSRVRVDLIDASRLVTDFLLPTLNSLPLGKRHRDEWLQQDVNGQWLLDWLAPLYRHAKGLSQPFEIAYNQQVRLDRALDRMARQIEMGIGAMEGPSPVSGAGDITNTL